MVPRTHIATLSRSARLGVRFFRQRIQSGATRRNTVSVAPVRILVVDDSAADAVLLTKTLENAGLKVESLRVESETGMAAALRASAWDLILADFSVPGFGALGALNMVTGRGLDVPVIVVSGVIDEDTAAVVFRAGAAD